MDIITEKHPLVICISCLEVIHTRDPMVPSIHGPYHAPPLTCVEGRAELEDVFS